MDSSRTAGCVNSNGPADHEPQVSNFPCSSPFATLTLAYATLQAAAATATLASCAVFLSNDVGFRRVPGLSGVIFDEVLAAP
jgi:hypothetical protein